MGCTCTAFVLPAFQNIPVKIVFKMLLFVWLQNPATPSPRRFFWCIHVKSAPSRNKDHCDEGDETPLHRTYLRSLARNIRKMISEMSSGKNSGKRLTFITILQWCMPLVSINKGYKSLKTHVSFTFWNQVPLSFGDKNHR